jgi:hypothetical protein
MTIMGNNNNNKSLISNGKGRFLTDEERELKRLQQILRRAVMKETAPEALRLRIQRMIRES